VGLCRSEPANTKPGCEVGIVILQDFLQKALANKEAKKKMSPTNAKALNSMRQRLRKHNQMFAEQIEKFRENPVSSESEASAEEDAESDSESGMGCWK
jgi:translation initiation factor 3 subunit C